MPTTYGMVLSFCTDISHGLLAACISDVNKTMLLAHAGFIPLLIEGSAGLLADDCFRKGAGAAVKASVQRDFAECTSCCQPPLRSSASVPPKQTDSILADPTGIDLRLCVWAARIDAWRLTLA